jgi:hypothetical protein
MRTPGKKLGEDERALAKRNVERRYPKADRIEIHPYSDGLYGEVWKDGVAEITPAFAEEE